MGILHQDLHSMRVDSPTCFLHDTAWCLHKQFLPSYSHCYAFDFVSLFLLFILQILLTKGISSLSLFSVASKECSLPCNMHSVQALAHYHSTFSCFQHVHVICHNRLVTFLCESEWHPLSEHLSQSNRIFCLFGADLRICFHTHS